MKRPLLLDLFCGAGGCGFGYHIAGFDVVGVDIEPQKNYPFRFYRGDALEFLRQHGSLFDAVHASPPCQSFSALNTMKNLRKDHPRLIEPSRLLLKMTGKPYVIENVMGAKLHMASPTILCGTMFGLNLNGGETELQRHRVFETSFALEAPRPCKHVAPRCIGLFGSKARDTAAEKRHYKKPKDTRGEPLGIQYSLDDARTVSGCTWMSMAEISQSIPPVYTCHIGSQLLRQMGYDPDALRRSLKWDGREWRVA